MNIDEFDFNLPQDLIAQQPVSPRHNSKLLSCINSKLDDLHFYDLPNLLNPGDVIVVNDTKVLKAKLIGFVNEKKLNFNLHMKNSEDEWFSFCKPAKKCKKNDEVHFSKSLRAKILEKKDHGELLLKFNFSGNDLLDQISKHGNIPLPPYIKNENLVNEQHYQTYFAKKIGAVAAPTAGLHFTKEIIDSLIKKKVVITSITLHVGAGTFLPIKTQNVHDHKMHFESFEISQNTVNILKNAKLNGRKIIAVGTTVMRTLEATFLKFNKIKSCSDKTDIYIKPGFKFNVVDYLLTNFHLPKSTLLILISAFSGEEEVKKIYDHAINKLYRFYSYGDCCLLKRKGNVNEI